MSVVDDINYKIYQFQKKQHCDPDFLILGFAIRHKLVSKVSAFTYNQIINMNTYRGIKLAVLNHHDDAHIIEPASGMK